MKILLRVLMVIVGLCGFIGIFSLLYYAGDNIGTNVQKGTGVVIGRVHHNSYSTLTGIVISYFPERWELCMKVGNDSGCVGVEEKDYHILNGTNLNITYTCGKWSKRLYIKNFIETN